MHKRNLINEKGSYVLKDESNSDHNNDEFFDALSVANDSISDVEGTFFHK
jgi:hypothetical protein